MFISFIFLFRILLECIYIYIYIYLFLVNQKPYLPALCPLAVKCVTEIAVLITVYGIKSLKVSKFHLY